MRTWASIGVAVLLAVQGMAADFRSGGDVVAGDYGVRNDTTLNSVLTSLATRTCRLVIDGGTWTISNNVTFATNIVVYVAPGSQFSILSGKTLTFNGGFEAGRYAVFTGSGTTAGSPKIMYRHSEWGSTTSYPLGSGVVEGVTNELLSTASTVSAAWAITNTSSTFADVSGANLVDKTATETISGTWTHSAAVVLDDGTGNSPTLTLTDGSDATLVLTKVDSGGATFTTSAGDITLTPNGTEVIVAGGLSVGTTSAAGDNNILLDGNITGSDGVSVLTNFYAVTTDYVYGDGAALVLGDGTDTVAINSGDWDISTVGAMTGMGSIGMDGDLTLTDADGDGNCYVKGYSAYDGVLHLYADAGADNADKWHVLSRASDNDLVVVNNTTTTNARLNTSGDLRLTGDITVDGNDIKNTTGDITITPVGDDVLIDGGLTVGASGAAGDNNLLVDGTGTFTGNATFNGDVLGDGSTIVTNMAIVATTSAQVASRYPLLGPNMTTQYAMEVGIATNGQTITFATPFSVAPVVICTVQGSLAAATAANSVGTTTFVMVGPTGTNIAYIAVGTK